MTFSSSSSNYYQVRQMLVWTPRWAGDFADPNMKSDPQAEERTHCPHSLPAIHQALTGLYPLIWGKERGGALWSSPLRQRWLCPWSPSSRPVIAYSSSPRMRQLLSSSSDNTSRVKPTQVVRETLNRMTVAPALWPRRKATKQGTPAPSCRGLCRSCSCGMGVTVA